MFWKSLVAVWILICCLCSANVFAAPQELSAKGEYRLGDRDNRETAKMAALADAKRKIIEQAGVYIQSYSEMNDLELTKDQVKSTANAMIKVKSEDVSFSENGTLCTAFVTALIDTADIEDFVRPFARDVKTPDKKFLKIANIEEYNGHYYKVFNDGLTWAQAKQRCEEIGGHLVTITSNIEQAVVQGLLSKQGTKGYYWTSGIRNSDDSWSWTTGEKFTYSNWGKGEPNNGVGNEDTVTLYRSGIWNDSPAEGISDIPNLAFYKVENSGFICEWDSYEAIKL